MRLLKYIYAILPRISVPLCPKEVPFCPNLSRSIWTMGSRLDEMHHVSYMYCPWLSQNGVKMWKRGNDYIQPHSAVLRLNSSQQSMSSIPMFHFYPTCHFTQTYRVPFYLGITFEYNVSCQLQYRPLLDQKGLKIRKRVKQSYIITLCGSVAYFIKAVDAGTWVNWYIEMGKLHFCVVFKMWSSTNLILLCQATLANGGINADATTEPHLARFFF